jgi:hypothetical protein
VPWRAHSPRNAPVRRFVPPISTRDRAGRSAIFSALFSERFTHVFPPNPHHPPADASAGKDGVSTNLTSPVDMVGLGNIDDFDVNVRPPPARRFRGFTRAANPACARGSRLDRPG